MADCKNSQYNDIDNFFAFLKKQLYRSFYINFVSRIERPLMEKFAQQLVTTNSYHYITKVYDQYLDLIALEPHLFTLNIKDSFIAYNDPSLGEPQIRSLEYYIRNIHNIFYYNIICNSAQCILRCMFRSFMSQVSMGLVSLVRCMGVMPYIRYVHDRTGNEHRNIYICTYE